MSRSRTLEELLRLDGFTPAGQGRWTFRVGDHVLEVMAEPWGGTLFAVYQADNPLTPLREWHESDPSAVPGSVTLGKAWVYLLVDRQVANVPSSVWPLSKAAGPAVKSTIMR